MAKNIPVTIYKDTIIQALLDSDMLTLAMAHSTPDFLQQPIPDNRVNLVYDTIFPYKHVPNIQELAKTFITMAVNIQWDNKNRRVLRNLDIYLYVFTHQSLQRTNYGAIRTDMMSDEIGKIMNGVNYLGVGKMYMSDYYEYQMAESEYNGVVMKYSGKDLNGKAFLV